MFTVQLHVPLGCRVQWNPRNGFYCQRRGRKPGAMNSTIHPQTPHTNPHLTQVLNRYFHVYFPRAIALANSLRTRGGTEEFKFTTHPVRHRVSCPSKHMPSTSCTHHQPPIPPPPPPVARQHVHRLPSLLDTQRSAPAVSHTKRAATL